MNDLSIILLEALNNTILVSIKGIFLPLKSEINIYFNAFWSGVAAIFGAVLGAAITIWYKKAELNSMKKNLDAQITSHNETQKNNENKIKAELVRLQDLSNNYKLSLAKFDFNHLEKVLQFGDDKNEKVAMMKDFAAMLSKYNPEDPVWIDDYTEYQQYISTHVYFSLDNIKNDIKDLLEKHVSSFVGLHESFQKVAGKAENLIVQRNQFTMYSSDVEDASIINHHFESLFALHSSYNDLLNLMKEEFKELDKIKRAFILNEAKKRV